MKYKYKKSSIYIQWISAALFVALLLGFYYLIGTRKGLLIKMAFGSAGIFLVMFTRFNKEYLNRYVELLDDYISFNSFRFKDIKMKKAVSFNVRYEDVWSIETKRLPLIGVWAIAVDAKNLPHKMTISFCFAKHKELSRNLCNLVKQHNPDAYIDTHLMRYIEE